MTRFFKVTVPIQFQDTFLDDNLVYEKEFISLYISGISEKVKPISHSYFLIFFNAQCIVYDTCSFLNFGELLWLIKPISDKWSQLK